MKERKKGFTLAELLIVMAIIMVLAAIAIPKFTTQRENAKETADVNALRAAYSEAMSDYLLKPSDSDKETVENVKLVSNGAFEYAKPDLPFSGLTDLSVTPDVYAITFDFSAEKPSVSIKAQP